MSDALTDLGEGRVTVVKVFTISKKEDTKDVFPFFIRKHFEGHIMGFEKVNQ